ncbi:MAG TPA: PAS domain S-box protein, partial [Chitinophagaceae bacterium]|nr:PAS domain S-box protein [Chitinophagaceae bacterium]
DKNVFISEYRFKVEGETGYRSIYDRCYIVRNKDGKAIRMMGSMMDVSERKEIEKALAKSENYLRTIVQAEPECVKLINSNGELEDMNPAGLAMIEADSLEQVKGKSLLAIIDNPYRLLFQELIQNVFRGKPGKLEFEITGLKGTRRWLETHSVPLRDVTGKIVSLLGVTRDISERKKIEQELREAEIKFRNLVEQSLVGVYIIQDGKFAYVNPKFAEIFGYNQQELINSYPIEIVVHSDDRPIVAENVRARLQGEQTSIHYEANGQKKNGDIIRAEIFGSRTEYEGKPAIIGTLLDISHRKKGEEKLKQSYEEIRRLSDHLQKVREEERTHIAREIHDELGQQLTVLKMDTSWLKKRLASADDAIRKKLDDLLELLDDTVKTVRRISSELRPSLLDDMGLVAAMEWHLKEFEKRAAVKTMFAYPDKELLLPDVIKTGLFRIFQESLTNVARHAGAKTIKINLQKENKRIVLNIEDDGKGFEQEKATNKKTLGILGMKERTFMMGGNYQIKSKPGKGTQVVVSVPYRQNDDE